jgi:secreted trypsin-like serine protease
MRLIFGVLLVVSLTLAHTSIKKDGKRDKRDYFVLVPHPVSPVVVYPVSPVIPSSPIRDMMGMSMLPPASAQPPAAVCGSPAFMCQGACSSRSVGGIMAVQAELPWNVQIYSSNRHICSGSLVDNRYVLTSASCVDPTTPASVAALRVRLGDFNRNSNSDGQYVERNVTTVYRHSDFVPQKSNSAPLNNIALIKLGQPVTFTDRIRPICLDEVSTRVDTGTNEGIVSGYGVLSYSNQRQTDDLYKVIVRIGTPQECQNAYSQHGYRLTDREICAGVETPGLPDPCVGDDGGPIIVKTGPNSYKQVGISSFGYKCGGPPQVFTRISSYWQWIDQVRFYYNENSL